MASSDRSQSGLHPYRTVRQSAIRGTLFVASRIEKDPRRRRRRFDPHVRLHLWLLNSEAWRSLTAAARALYVQIAARYNGSNNGAMGCSVRNAAEECRISKNIAFRAFKELIQTGFIGLKTPCAFSRKVRHGAPTTGALWFHIPAHHSPRSDRCC